MFRRTGDRPGNGLSFPGVQLPDETVAGNPVATDRIADELMFFGGVPIATSGVRLIGFRSVRLRDRAVDAVRSRYGWTCVEPVDLGQALSERLPTEGDHAADHVYTVGL